MPTSPRYYANLAEQSIASVPAAHGRPHHGCRRLVLAPPVMEEQRGRQPGRVQRRGWGRGRPGGGGRVGRGEGRGALRGGGGGGFRHARRGVGWGGCVGCVSRIYSRIPTRGTLGRAMLERPHPGHERLAPSGGLHRVLGARRKPGTNRWRRLWRPTHLARARLRRRRRRRRAGRVARQDGSGGGSGGWWRWRRLLLWRRAERVPRCATLHSALIVRH